VTRGRREQRDAATLLPSTKGIRTPRQSSSVRQAGVSPSLHVAAHLVTVPTPTQQTRPAPQSLADMHSSGEASQGAEAGIQRGQRSSAQHTGVSPSQRVVPQRTCDPRRFASRGRVLIQGPGSTEGLGSAEGPGPAVESAGGVRTGAAAGQMAIEDTTGGAEERGAGRMGSASPVAPRHATKARRESSVAGKAARHAVTPARYHAVAPRSCRAAIELRYLRRRCRPTSAAR
jgi:hypothetical protein